MDDGNLFELTNQLPNAGVNAANACNHRRLPFCKANMKAVRQRSDCDDYHRRTKWSSPMHGRSLARSCLRSPRGLLAQERHSRGNDPHWTGIVGMDHARPSRRRGTGLPGLSRTLARGNRVHCVPRRARVSVLLVCIQDLRNNSHTEMGDWE